MSSDVQRRQLAELDRRVVAALVNECDDITEAVHRIARHAYAVSPLHCKQTMQGASLTTGLVPGRQSRLLTPAGR